MKTLKRFAAVILCITLITSVMTGCSSLNLKNNALYITKAEWIETLGRYFGLDDYVETEPHFIDVDINDQVFPYAQACYEWDVIPHDKALNPSEKITREYAFATCVYGLGAEKTKIGISDTNIKDAANYAYENKIADAKSWLYMHEGVTQKEAVSILEKTLTRLSEYMFPQYDNSKYTSNVKKCSDSEEYTILYGGNLIEFSDESAADRYTKGDVIIVKEDGVDTPTKIKSVEKKDGKTIVETCVPSIEEIYETIDFSEVGTVTNPNDIKVYDGFTLQSFNGKSVQNTANFEEPQVDYLGTASGEDIKTENTWWGDFDVGKKFERADLSFGVSIKNGKPSVSASIGGTLNEKFSYDPDGNKISLKELEEWADAESIPKNKIKDVKKLAEPKWIKGSYEITGTVEIKDFYVQASAKGNAFNLGDIEASIETNMQVDASVELKGKVSVDKNIGEIPIQLGSTPFKINITLALVGEISGSFKVTWSISNNTLVEYKNHSLRKSTSRNASKTVELKGKVEAGIGPRAHLAIGVLTFDIDILNLTLTVGFTFTASVKWANLIQLSDGVLYRCGGDEDSPAALEAGISYRDVSLICTETEFEFPLIKLSFCDDPNTLLNKFNISGDFVLVGKKGAIKINTDKHHYEGSPLKEVKECRIDALKKYHLADDLEKETTTEQSDNQTDNSNSLKQEGLQISTYSLDIKPSESQKIEIISLPKEKSTSDVSVSVDDTGVATAQINDKTIIVNGKEEGVTTVTIKCGDEELNCIVMVAE